MKKVLDRLVACSKVTGNPSETDPARVREAAALRADCIS